MNQQRKETIGWVESVSLRLWNAEGNALKLGYKAKVDTGAYSSSLHATEIVTLHRDERSYVRFCIPEAGRSREVEAPLLKRGFVKTSEGGREFRYFVQLEVHAGELSRPVIFSLNDRSGMLYPVLLGRNFLRDHFIVDVSQTFILTKRSFGAGLSLS